MGVWLRCCQRDSTATLGITQLGSNQNGISIGLGSSALISSQRNIVVEDMQTCACSVIPLASDVTLLGSEYELMWGWARQQLQTKAFVATQTNIALKHTFNNGENTDRSDTGIYQCGSGSYQMLRAVAGIPGAAMGQGIATIASPPFQTIDDIVSSQDHRFQHQLFLPSLMR